MDSRCVPGIGNKSPFRKGLHIPQTEDSFVEDSFPPQAALSPLLQALEEVSLAPCGSREDQDEAAILGHAEEEVEEGEEQYTEDVWEAFFVLDDIRPILEAGPRWKLESFLESLDRLQEAQAVLLSGECHRGIRQAEQLLAMAMARLLEEFEDALRKHSKPLSPPMLRELAMSAHAESLSEACSSSSGSSSRHWDEKSGPSTGGLSPRVMPITPRGESRDSSWQRRSNSGPIPSALSSSSGVASSSGGKSRSHGSNSLISAKTTSTIRAPSASSRGMSSPTAAARGASPSSSGSSSPSSSQSVARNVSAATQAALHNWWPVQAVVYLQRMAKKLMQGGEAKKCVEVFIRVRSRAIQEAVDGLAVEPLEVAALDILPWGEMEKMMRRWREEMRVLILVLLGGERDLVDLIFEGANSEKEVCFQGLVEGSRLPAALRCLVRNGSAIARSQSNVERLFALLDMFTSTRELRQQVDAITSLNCMTPALTAMEQLPADLAAAVMATFEAFRQVLANPVVPSGSEKKRSVLHHLVGRGKPQTLSDEILPATGGVHQVTSYVVNYINLYLDRSKPTNYPGALECLYDEHCGSVEGAARSMERETEMLLDGVLSNMESRASSCNDDVLAALFLLNNANYILRNMSDSSGRFLVDLPAWQNKSVVEKYAKRFEDAALQKITAALTGEIPTSFMGGEMRDLKVRLKSFNTAFEELAIKQAGWMIPDEIWRKATRVRVAQRLKALYASYLLPHREELCEVRSYRYTPDAIERIVLDYFFLGTPTRILLPI